MRGLWRAAHVQFLGAGLSDTVLHLLYKDTLSRYLAWRRVSWDDMLHYFIDVLALCGPRGCNVA